MTSSLVGSEMCIRDSHKAGRSSAWEVANWRTGCEVSQRHDQQTAQTNATVSYTHLTLPTICSV
eukprot:9065618-Prorocentrum_lima.AAC.1